MTDKEHVDHPDHYGGEDNPYEAIKVIEAWEASFCIGNTLKYLCRVGKKVVDKELEDMKKAAWYLNREIETLEKELDIAPAPVKPTDNVSFSQKEITIITNAIDSDMILDSMSIAQAKALCKKLNIH